jgi:hypothetical protein
MLQIVRECFFALMGLRSFVFETDDKTNVYMLRTDVAVTSLSPRALRNALLDTIRLANDLAKLRGTAARLTGAYLVCNLGGPLFKVFNHLLRPRTYMVSNTTLAWLWNLHQASISVAGCYTRWG